MIKKHLLAIALIAVSFLASNSANAQAGLSVNNNGAVAAASAMLDVTSTTQGMLVPRMTAVQRNSIGSPATGLLVYTTDVTPGFYYWTSTAWVNITSAATAAGGDLTGTYPSPTVASNAITSAKIVDGTIVNADVSATAAIAYSKLNLASSIALTDLSATGTPSSSTFLRGDNTWATVSGGSGTVTSVAVGNLSPIFTTSVSNATTTPSISYSLSNAGARTVLTNSTSASGVPSYAPVSPLCLANNGGTASSSTFYRGDGQWATPSGGASFGNSTILSASTTSYTITSTDGVVVMPFTGTTATITLPNATGFTAREYHFVFPAASAVPNITLSPSSGVSVEDLAGAGGFRTTSESLSCAAFACTLWPVSATQWVVINWQ